MADNSQSEYSEHLTESLLENHTGTKESILCSGSSQGKGLSEHSFQTSSTSKRLGACYAKGKSCHKVGLAVKCNSNSGNLTNRQGRNSGKHVMVPQASTARPCSKLSNGAALNPTSWREGSVDTESHLCRVECLSQGASAQAANQVDGERSKDWEKDLASVKTYGERLEQDKINISSLSLTKADTSQKSRVKVPKLKRKSPNSATNTNGTKEDDTLYKNDTVQSESVKKQEITLVQKETVTAAVPSISSDSLNVTVPTDGLGTECEQKRYAAFHENHSVENDRSAPSKSSGVFGTEVPPSGGQIAAAAKMFACTGQTITAGSLARNLEVHSGSNAPVVCCADSDASSMSPRIPSNGHPRQCANLKNKSESQTAGDSSEVILETVPARLSDQRTALASTDGNGVQANPIVGASTQTARSTSCASSAPKQATVPSAAASASVPKAHCRYPDSTSTSSTATMSPVPILESSVTATVRQLPCPLPTGNTPHEIEISSCSRAVPNKAGDSGASACQTTNECQNNSNDSRGASATSAGSLEQGTVITPSRAEGLSLGSGAAERTNDPSPPERCVVAKASLGAPKTVESPASASDARPGLLYPYATMCSSDWLSKINEKTGMATYYTNAIPNFG